MESNTKLTSVKGLSASVELEQRIKQLREAKDDAYLNNDRLRYVAIGETIVDLQRELDGLTKQ